MKIDRSKKANRYCAHCINFEKKEKNPDYINPLSSHAAKYRKPYICPAADRKLIDYWNRCQLPRPSADALEVGACDCPVV